MQHNFNIQIAREYGINVAVFLNHLAFWVKKNQNTKRHFHDGNYWTYNSIESFTSLFGYWSRRQMRNIIDKCIKNGLILEGNYNLTTYDRTKWYALTPKAQELLNFTICQKGQMDLTKRANRFAQNVKPIPDIKPDNKPDKRERAIERTKRVPLSAFKPSQRMNERITEVETKTGNKNILQKFINVMKAKGKLESFDWDAELSVFLDRERPQTKITSIFSTEIKNTTKFWEPGNPDYDRVNGIGSITNGSKDPRNNTGGGYMQKATDYLCRR